MTESSPHGSTRPLAVMHRKIPCSHGTTIVHQHGTTTTRLRDAKVTILFSHRFQPSISSLLLRRFLKSSLLRVTFAKAVLAALLRKKKIFCRKKIKKKICFESDLFI